MPDTDEALAQAAGRGDRAALSTLYRRYCEPIYRYALARAGTRQHAEDLTAEVFARVVESLPRYEPLRGCFRAWLYGIARHACADFWRQRTDTVELPLDDLLASPATPEPDAEDGRLRKWALALLGSLPPQYRRVLELRILEGRSLADAAEAMGITRNYVKVLQHRALRRAAKLADNDVLRSTNNDKNS
jgi:RNA polymerase sigma factor (sigma-70 family)